MANDDQQESYEKLLSATLTRALDLLKFAEAKNAGLLAFAAAWIVASTNLLSSDKSLPPHVTLAVTAATPLWGLAALTAMWAILPIMSRRPFLPEIQTFSLLYSGDVAMMKLEEFRQQVREQFYPPDGATVTDHYLADLVGQIHAISRISDRKFRLFHWGAWAVLSALAIITAPFMLLLGRWVLCG